MSSGSGTGTRVVSPSTYASTPQEIYDAIYAIFKDDYINILEYMNTGLQSIAGGIKLPMELGNMISPCLPLLYKKGTVTTVVGVAYASLPTDYQRNVFHVYDDTQQKILPPNEGDYYAFSRFLRQVSDPSLAESGEVYRVCVKGNSLYYQGIPATAYTMGVHYYRRPNKIALADTTVDGLPDHLAMRLLKHWACKEVFGERIEDGQDNVGQGVRYHLGKFWEAMGELVNFVGIDAEPTYYGSDSTGWDRGTVD